jgi:hypothetical protein
VDAVTLEIIRGKLLALADEMGIVLTRTTMSPVIYEVLDFVCGLCDPEGWLVAQINGITGFERSLNSWSRSGREVWARGTPYFTDAAALKPAFDGAPTVILGPGDMTLAHQTDEYCAVEIEEAANIYKAIARRRSEM